MVDFIGDVECQYESYCDIAEEYGFLDDNAAKSGFRCTVKKPEFNAGWIGFTGGVAFCRDEIYRTNKEIDSLKAENIELQKKYQHADTQLSDIDGHYTLLKKEVEALKAKLEQSKKVWISVDFMLPDEGEKVLLAIGDEQTVAEKCRVFGFIDSIDREALRTDLITHWMSLPEPPSKEAQGDGDE